MKDFSVVTEIVVGRQKLRVFHQHLQEEEWVKMMSALDISGKLLITWLYNFWNCHDLSSWIIIPDLNLQRLTPMAKVYDHFAYQNIV